MSDELIESQVARFGRNLRRMFKRLAPQYPIDAVDEQIIDSFKLHVKRGLYARRAARISARKRHEKTRDLFEDKP